MQSDIYTQVNILEKIIGRRRKKIAELIKNCNLEDFADREDKPGLLAYLALPKSQISSFSTPPVKNNVEKTWELEQIFNKGKALILLDGLDEVLDADSDRVLKEIRNFSIQFSKNQYIIRQSSELALEQLVSHLFKKRWREVFFLAVSMSPNADRLVLLIKQKIDKLMSEDKDLQRYLQWLKHQNIGHDWQFSGTQKELLENYYLANQLLTQCLHQECYVSREVRQEIEETLLLPIAEIEKRQLN